MKHISAVLAALVAASVAATLPAQVKERPIPRLVKKDGRYALMVDGAPYLMLGAQTHNSSAWAAMLPKVWPAMELLNVNTVETPVYWEQFEPRQGQYDHTVIDALLAGARQHKVRLLWGRSARPHVKPARNAVCRGAGITTGGALRTPADGPAPHRGPPA